MGTSVRPNPIDTALGGQNPIDAALSARKKPRGYRTEDQIKRLNRMDAAVAELGPLETLAGGAAAAGQGLMLGWGDEAAAALRSLGPKTYPEALADVRAEQGIFGREYPKANIALNVAGAMLNPVRVPGGGWRRTAASAGLLGGAAGAGYTEGGAADRAVGAGVGAGAALTGAGILGAGARPIRYLTSVARSARAPSLGKTEETLRKARQANDEVNYKIALTKWGNPLTQKVSQMLEKDPDIAPVVAQLRGMRQHANQNPADPEFLDAVYKNAVSDWKLRLDKAVQRAAETPTDATKANAARALKTHILELRDEFLTALDEQMPGYRKAVEESAAARSLEKTFAEVADAARRVIEKPPIAGKNIASRSPEAFEAKIEKMSPEKAEVAILASLGRGREAIRFTSNPVGKFGLQASIARAIRAPVVLDRYLQLMERQAGRGRKPSVDWRGPVSRGIVAGLFAGQR